MKPWLIRSCSVITIAVVAAGGFYANQLKQERDELRSRLEEAKDAASRLSGDLAVASKELDGVTRDLKDARGRLETANSDIEARKKQIEAEKVERQKVEDNIKKVSQQKADVQAALDKYKRVLPADLPPDQIQGKLKELEDKLGALDQEKKILKDRLAVLEVENKQGEERDKFRAGSKPIPSLSGRIVAVDAAGHFVVLDVGSRHGLVEKYPLLVYRGSKLVGKVMVTAVTPSTATADILPEEKRDEILEGDAVVP